MGNNNNNNSNNNSNINNGNSYYQQQQNNDDYMEYLSSIQQKSTTTGPFNIDPLHYTEFCICVLFSFALYLFIPRGFRFTFCGSYPKRYAWSSRIKRRRERRRLKKLGGGGGGGVGGYGVNNSNIKNGNGLPTHHISNYKNNDGGGGASSISVQSVESYSTTGSNSAMNTNHRQLSTQGIGPSLSTNNHNHHQHNIHNRYIHNYNDIHQSVPEEEEIVDFTSPQPSTSTIHRNRLNPQYSNTTNNNTPLSTITNTSSNFNDEIAISTTMSQLRDTGIKIIAHGSKGKPKSVRLLLTENAIEWRTEPSPSSSTNPNKKRKNGKTHQVPLSHIMYVDVGKQTTALRRVENASISDSVCLSLLTRDGSLDLEAKNSVERDALVNCFSLVLDEVHSAKNWRDVYRAPSSDLPSSFDEFDMIMGGPSAGGGGGGIGGDERMEV